MSANDINHDKSNKLKPMVKLSPINHNIINGFLNVNKEDANIDEI